MALQANTGLRNDLLLAITIVMITVKTGEDRVKIVMIMSRRKLSLNREDMKAN